MCKFSYLLEKISVTTQIRQNPVSKSAKKNKCDLTLIREVRVSPLPTTRRARTTPTIFEPSNPRLPVELFLAMIESDVSTQDPNTSSRLLIAQAISAIDATKLDEQFWQLLQVTLESFFLFFY